MADNDTIPNIPMDHEFAKSSISMFIESGHVDKLVQEKAREEKLAVYTATLDNLMTSLEASALDINNRSAGTKGTDIDSKLDKLHLGESYASNENSASFQRTTYLSRKEFDDTIKVVSNDIIQIQHLMEAHVFQAMKDKDNFERKINDLIPLINRKTKPMKTDGRFIWKITGVAEKFLEQSRTHDVSKMSMTSERFQTQSGHEFRLRCFLNGTGQGHKKNVSCFVQMCKTSMDETLVFPFSGIIQFRLYDQADTNEKKHHVLRFRTNNSACFQRPDRDKDFCPENGLALFFSNEFLTKPMNDPQKSPCYLKNDTIFIGVEITPPGSMPASSS